MTKLLLSFTFFLFVFKVSGQTIETKLRNAYQRFESDTQLKHAISSLYVIDAKTGDIIFDKNSAIGLAPASTQKIIISATAFEVLGKDFRYKTELGYTGKIVSNRLDGDLIIAGTGDPTLGSWRYASTGENVILDKWTAAVSAAGIKTFGRIISATQFEDYSPKNIPDGWIWQDVGNYYGAAAYNLNWRENQYDLLLSSQDFIGGKVSVESTKPAYYRNNSFVNLMTAGAPGTGDNVYIYLKDGHHILTGTVPTSVKNFKVSGSVLAPGKDLFSGFNRSLLQKNIRSTAENDSLSSSVHHVSNATKGKVDYQVIATHSSPTLDSIIYWFNKKSVNLYGEALIRTLGQEKTSVLSTDSGLSVVRSFWKTKGVSEDELNIYDGSGLSPLNRVTTHAQVTILKHATTRDWFPAFLNALPEYNGMKMKSGTISDVKGFCGYHRSKDGREYIYSFLVNNYSGKSASLVNKMYEVLNVLK